MPAVTIGEPLAKPTRSPLADQIADAQERAVSSAYDYATIYTAVIIFGGYAGFFAIWQLTKEYLSKEQALWSAIFILTSLLSFILFEVFKMVLVTSQVLKQRKVLDAPEIRSDPQKLLAALQGLEKAQKPSFRWFIVAWSVVVAVALMTALAGTAVLAYAFISGLSR
jgi:MFS family permease